MQSLPSMALRGALIASLLAGGLLAQGPSCWDSNHGSRIADGDDANSTAQTLPFSFPLPGGGTTNQIIACTNGFIWLDGTSTSHDLSPTPAELVSNPARVAVGWADLVCSSGTSAEDGVFLSTTATTATITWRGHDFGTTNTVWMQCQLISDGTIVITHRQVDQYPGIAISHSMLVGVSEGSNNMAGMATDPGETDFSAGTAMSGSNPTIYEQFDVAVPEMRDIGTIPTLIMAPNSGGYTVVGTSCGPFAGHNAYGSGCPGSARDGAFYELFDGTVSVNDIASLGGLMLASTGTGYAVSSAPIWEPNFANAITTGDDAVTDEPLPFTANFGGVVTGTIGIDSNGRVWLSGSQISNFSENSASFVSNAASVAPLWDDLNPLNGGSVFYDTFPATMSTPARAVITWSGVPDTGRPTPTPSRSSSSTPATSRSAIRRWRRPTASSASASVAAPPTPARSTSAPRCRSSS